MAKSYEELKRQAAVIKNETEVGANTANRVGAMFEDAIDFSYSALAVANAAVGQANDAADRANAAQQSADTAQQTANAAQQSADTAQQTANAAQQSADTASTKVEELKQQVGGLITAQNIYDALPKGSILQSAYGNIFGDKWAPMENVVTWDLSNVEEIDGTVIKGYMKAVYAKGYYYCYVLGGYLYYSSDLESWQLADLRGDGQLYNLLSLTYSKTNDTLFATAIVDENNTVKSYYSKDGITWNEYTVGDAVIVGFVVSGNNTMLATVIDGTFEKIKYYIADGTDIESVSWSLLSDKEYIPTLYSAGCIYFDDTRSRYITVTGDGIYEKGDDTTSLLELKSSLPENIAMPELSANDKDNTYILRSRWDIHRFTYIAKNKDTSTWEEFKVQVSTDGEMLSSFVFSIKDIYYVLQPVTFVGGTLDSITLMGYAVFEYAVTDGEYFIGFNFTEGKIYRTKLAQALEAVQYGYIKIE